MRCASANTDHASDNGRGESARLDHDEGGRLRRRRAHGGAHAEFVHAGADGFRNPSVDSGGQECRQGAEDGERREGDAAVCEGRGDVLSGRLNSSDRDFGVAAWMASRSVQGTPARRRRFSRERHDFAGVGAVDLGFDFPILAHVGNVADESFAQWNGYSHRKTLSIGERRDDVSGLAFQRVRIVCLPRPAKIEFSTQEENSWQLQPAARRWWWMWGG